MSLRDNPCKSKSLTSKEETRAKTGKTLQQPNNKSANMVVDAKQIFYIEDKLLLCLVPNIRIVLSTLCMNASVSYRNADLWDLGIINNVAMWPGKREAGIGGGGCEGMCSLF